MARHVENRSKRFQGYPPPESSTESHWNASEIYQQRDYMNAGISSPHSFSIHTPLRRDSSIDNVHNMGSPPSVSRIRAPNGKCSPQSPYGNYTLSENQISICKWFFIRLPADSSKVSLGGYVLYGNQSEFVQTAHVVERLQKSRVRTSDGKEILLMGAMDVKETMNNGFSDKVAEAFFLGFPVAWRNVFSDDAELAKMREAMRSLRSQQDANKQDSQPSSTTDVPKTQPEVQAETRLEEPVHEDRPVPKPVDEVPKPVEEVRPGTEPVQETIPEGRPAEPVVEPVPEAIPETPSEPLVEPVPVPQSDGEAQFSGGVERLDSSQPKTSEPTQRPDTHSETAQAENPDQPETEDHREQETPMDVDVDVEVEADECAEIVDDPVPTEKPASKKRPRPKARKKKGRGRKAATPKQIPAKRQRVEDDPSDEPTSEADKTDEHLGGSGDDQEKTPEPQKKKIKRSLPPPLPAPRVKKDEVIEAYGLKTSRSGRLLVPPLAYWRNQTLAHDKDGGIIAILEGFEERPSDTGNYNFKAPTQKKAIKLQEKLCATAETPDAKMNKSKQKSQKLSSGSEERQKSPNEQQQKKSSQQQKKSSNGNEEQQQESGNEEQRQTRKKRGSTPSGRGRTRRKTV